MFITLADSFFQQLPGTELIKRSCNITALDKATAAAPEFQPLQLKVDSASKKGERGEKWELGLRGWG